MEKLKKTSRVLLGVSLVLMLLCGIVVHMIQTNWGKVDMQELTIETDHGYTMSAYLFVPETATELITGGFTPWEARTNVDFQEILIELQLKKERIK